MFRWPVILLLCGEVLKVDSQTLRYAENRVINAAGVDYGYQHQISTVQPTPGLSAYSEFVQKPTDPTTGEMPKNVRTIIVTKKVPVPYPVHVEKKVPYPVKVPIRRPYTVYVPRPYLVEVMKQVPVPVKVPFPQPYTVEKHVPVPYKVHYDKPFPVHITKPYPVYFEKRVPIHIEKPVPVPYKVPVDRPIPLHIPLDKPVLYPVQRPLHFPVKVPVEKPIPSHVEKPLPVPITLEKPYPAAAESVANEYYSSTQPTIHQHTFSPSPYDEVTSTLLTQGKHKVISFLPGSQNNFHGSYQPQDQNDIGTIHVSDIKSSGGNATDWVPKHYIPNSQYLTYIPNAHSKYVKYVVPEKTTKLAQTNLAEPYSPKLNTLKMQYKLHYDPAKQEYSFQLVPKTSGSDGIAHSGYSYQALGPENKPQQSGQATNPQTEYVYKPIVDYPGASDSNTQTKISDNGLTYSYQQIFQGSGGKQEFQSLQSEENSQGHSYTYPQTQNNYKPETTYSYHVDASGKPVDANEHASQQQPHVTYSYQPIQTESKENYHSQQLGDQQQVSYSYQTVGNDGKIGFDVQHELKNADSYPNQQVSYMYLPEVGNSYSETKENSNPVPSYSISSDHNEMNTEYPQILYQQGRVATIMRDEYVTSQPAINEHTGIPSNLKTSRTTESLSLLQSNDQSTSNTPTDHSKGNYYVHNVHPNLDNRTTDSGATSSITFQKFGVADVMSTVRTRLYPVNESDTDVLGDTTKPYYESKILTEKEEDSTPEYPYNGKVYRLSSYKVPRSKRVHRRKKVQREKQIEEHTFGYSEEGDTTTDLWSKVFGVDETTTQRTVRKSKKDTNSHTGAAERAPFFGYERSSTATTPSSPSLLPPEDPITAKPTESIRGKYRGSMRAFGRRKTDAETTTPSSDTTHSRGTRRKRRPARRRMDTITEAPADPTTT